MPTEYVIAPSCPEFENFSSASTVNARSEGKTAMAMYNLCRKHDLHPPSSGDAPPALDWQMAPDQVVKLEPGWKPQQQPPLTNGRQSQKKRKARHLLVETAAYWQNSGFAAYSAKCDAVYDTTLCREVFEWLGLDATRPTSHGTRCPACMIGAIAAYIVRYPDNRQMARHWCIKYCRHHKTGGRSITLEHISGLYRRIAKPNSTASKEKVRVFFNTFMALKAFCSGQPCPAFSDPPEPINALVDPTIP